MSALDRLFGTLHPFFDVLFSTGAPILSKDVPLEEVGSGKIIQRFLQGQTILNHDVVSKLLARRLNELHIEGSFIDFLSRQTAKVLQLSNGQKVLIPPLNTDTDISSLPSNRRLKEFYVPTYTPPVVPEGRQGSKGVVVSGASDQSATFDPLQLFSGIPYQEYVDATVLPASNSLPPNSPIELKAFDYQSPYFPRAADILPPQNQYACGSCFALAVATAMSDCFIVSNLTDRNPNLSFTSAMSCAPFCSADSTMSACLRSKPNASLQCSGGSIASLCKWIEDNGLVSSSCVDYQWCAGSSDCNTTSPTLTEDQLSKMIPSCGCYTAGDTFQQFYIRDSESIYLEDTQLDDPDAILAHQVMMKQHLLTVGPMVGGIHVFKNFLSGQYQPPSNPSYNPFNIYLESVAGLDAPSDTLTDFQGCHALCIMGWALLPVHSSLLFSDVAESLTLDENGFAEIPCWKIRNSWGPSWCRGGYVYFAMAFSFSVELLNILF